MELKPDEPVAKEERMEIDTEVRAQAPETVAAHGTGKTGFVDTLMKSEEATKVEEPA